MTDASMRAAEREANTVEDRAALLLARWRAGEWVERQIEVPCSKCEGSRTDPEIMRYARSLSSEGDHLSAEKVLSYLGACSTCNGSGVRTIPGRELAAYVGDDRARYLLCWLDGFPEGAGAGWRPPDFAEWVRGLSRYGREVRVIAEVVVDTLVFSRSMDAGLSDSEFARWAAREAMRRGDEPTIRRAIQDALVPWALGEVE